MPDENEAQDVNQHSNGEAVVENNRELLIGTALGILGGAVGGAIGYFGFIWVLRQGLYAIILPGAMLGLGCRGLSGRRSLGLGLLCGVLGFALGLYTEARWLPFLQDPSFGFFLAHLPPIKWILIGLGGLCGYWFGLGREGGCWPRYTQSRGM